MVEPVAKAYKPWLIGSVAVLVCSLVMLAGAVTAGFFYFGEGGAPFWVVLLGGAAVLGVALGFAGFFTLMATAGWRSFREHRRVQVLSPKKHDPV